MGRKVDTMNAGDLLWSYVLAAYLIEGWPERGPRLLQALGKLRSEAGQLSGVLLDLRNNPGGLVREATAVADEFLSGGNIYSTRHRGQILKVEDAHRGGSYTRGSLVVLINEYSASAAELVAGALRDGRRAQLVGARTFGKGSVQTLLNMGYGGAIKLTTALYYTPAGRSIQGTGIDPDIAIAARPDDGNNRTYRESDLPNSIQNELDANETGDEAEEAQANIDYPPEDFKVEDDYQLMKAIQILKDGSYTAKLASVE